MSAAPYSQAVELDRQVVIKQVANSYIVDASSHGKEYVFKAHKVKEAIGSLLRERLSGQAYDPVIGTQTAKALADELRERFGELGCARHKLIVQAGQAMRVASRCLWDPANDGSASDSFENDTLVCTCQVYGLYLD